MTTTTTTNNPAFAFVINSILKKNKNQKLLSKAKKESEIIKDNNEQKRNDKIEFVNDDGQIIVDKNGDELIPNKNQNQNKMKNNEKRKLKNNTIRRRNDFNNSKDFQQQQNTWLIRLNNEDDEKEKQLKLIATKGVVQLFNVVRDKQKILKQKFRQSSNSESKRTKLLTEFDEQELKHDERISSSKKSNQKTKKRKWSVLSDDFMTGTKLKDWNEDSDNDDDD